MPSTPPRSRAAGAQTRPPAWPLATSAAGAVLLAAATGALTSRLLALWPDVLAARRLWSTPGTLGIDRLVAVPLLAVGAAVAAWWGVSLVLIAVSLLAERAGMRNAALGRCIHALAPRTLRRLAVAGVGAGLTFSALPAYAAESPPDLGWSATQPADDAELSSRAVREQPRAPLERAVPELAAMATAPSPPPAPTDPTSLGPLVPPEAVPATPPVDQPPKVDTPASAGSAPGTPTQPGAAGAATSAPSTPAPAGVDLSVAPADSTVVIAAGDTLWDLAAARLPPEATNAQIAASWGAWYALNAPVIGHDPDLLHPGQVLHVPQAD